MRAILTYHSIDDSGSPISVSPAAFRAHARFLGSGRVRVVPLRELAALAPEEDAVAITFDDGFENTARVAAPALAERGLPSTVFVVSDRVAGTNAWDDVAADGMPLLPLMSWDAVGRLGEQGVEVGAHTRRHRDLSRLRGAALEDEVAGCVEIIAANVGARPTSFAYPYGRWGADALVAVRDVYERAVTTELRALERSDDHALLPRVDMYYFRNPGQLEAWGTPAFRRRLWLRAQGRRVRALLANDRGGHAA